MQMQHKVDPTLWYFCGCPDMRGMRHNKVNYLLAATSRARFTILNKMTPEEFSANPPDRGMWLADQWLAGLIVGYGG